MQAVAETAGIRNKAGNCCAEHRGLVRGAGSDRSSLKRGGLAGGGAVSCCT
jgi:hypothetical protein